MISLRVIPERSRQAGAREGVTHRAAPALSPRWVLPTAPTAVADRTYRGSQPRHPLLPRLGAVGCGSSVPKRRAHKIAAEIRAGCTMLGHAAVRMMTTAATLSAESPCSH